MFDALMERTCNLQCRHCLFQNENSSYAYSMKNNLRKILINFAKKIPGNEIYFIHEGRIILPWHIEVLKGMKNIRPELKMGLIDNGSYMLHLKKFKEQDLKLDWLDISCDGTRDIHNKQRDPTLKRAYDMMLNGLTHAREITKPRGEGGRVTSLFTMTKINFNDIFKTAKVLFVKNELTSFSYIDEFHITVMNPHLPKNFPLDIGVEEMKIAFQQIKELQKEYKNKIFFRLYGHKHLKILAKAVGENVFWESFTNKLLLGHGAVQFVLECVPILYFPTSIWPQEGIFIDADGSQRHAYCQKYTLEELRLKDKEVYTVQHLKGKEDFVDSYKKGAQSWWNRFGENFLQEETDFFSYVKNIAENTPMIITK